VLALPKGKLSIALVGYSGGVEREEDWRNPAMESTATAVLSIGSVATQLAQGNFEQSVSKNKTVLFSLHFLHSIGRVKPI
jgi:hypothetical protein